MFRKTSAYFMKIIIKNIKQLKNWEKKNSRNKFISKKERVKATGFSLIISQITRGTN